MRDQEDNRRPEEIEGDIQRTRAEVGSTIDAIQSKLTPGQMMDQALTYARTSLPADFGANLGNTVRDNPMPVALVGVGLAWLMMSGRNSDGRARQRRQNAVYYAGDYDTRHFDDSEADAEYAGTFRGDFSSSDTSEGSQEGTMQKASAKAGEASQRVKGKASELSGKASELGEKASGFASRITGKASEMTGRARDAMSGARDRMSESANSGRSRMGDMSQRSQQQFYQAKSRVNNMLEEQPLAIGALGIAIGAMLGAALPATRREDEMLGRKRDDLLENAKATGREQAEHLKESAKRVAETAKNEANRTASSMSSSAGSAAGSGSSSSSTSGQASPGTGNGHANRMNPTSEADATKQSGPQGLH